MPTAPPQWNVSIVIKENGCGDVRCEQSKSEDEESNILQSEGHRGEQEWADERGAGGRLVHLHVDHLRFLTNDFLVCVLNPLKWLYLNTCLSFITWT